VSPSERVTAFERHLQAALEEIDRAREDSSTGLELLAGFEALREAATGTSVRQELVRWATLRRGAGLEESANPTLQALLDASSDDELQALAERLRDDARFQRLLTWVPTKREMLFAYGLQMASRILEADGVLSPDEIGFLRAAVAPDALGTATLFDQGKPTPKLSRAIECAMLLLPELLEDADRGWITTLLLNACSADGVIRPEELEEVEAGLMLIGIGREEIDRWATTLGHAGHPDRG